MIIRIAVCGRAIGRARRGTLESLDINLYALLDILNTRLAEIPVVSPRAGIQFRPRVPSPTLRSPTKTVGRRGGASGRKSMFREQVKRRRAIVNKDRVFQPLRRASSFASRRAPLFPSDVFLSPLRAAGGKERRARDARLRKSFVPPDLKGDALTASRGGKKCFLGASVRLRSDARLPAEIKAGPGPAASLSPLVLPGKSPGACFLRRTY